MPHLFDLGAGALRLHLEVCQAVGLGTGRQHGQRLVELIQNIAAHKQAQALARQRNTTAGGGADDSFALRAAAFAREHPLAIAAVGGVALVAGPRRLIRWAGVLLPLLMRLKR